MSSSGSSFNPKLALCEQFYISLVKLSSPFFVFVFFALHLLFRRFHHMWRTEFLCINYFFFFCSESWWKFKKCIAHLIRKDSSNLYRSWSREPERSDAQTRSASWNFDSNRAGKILYFFFFFTRLTLKTDWDPVKIFVWVK